MFRLFLIIISVFMISSCSNTQPLKKKTINSLSLHEQQNMEKKSMILIMDFGDSESQIIKCCDSLLTYGVGYVETANKTISEGDVAWNSDYQIIRKRLGTAQQKTIQVAISNWRILLIVILLLLRIMLNTPCMLTTIKLPLDTRLVLKISLQIYRQQ